MKIFKNNNIFRFITLKKMLFTCLTLIVLLLTIAYASLSLDLNVSGTMSLNSQDGVVMTDVSLAPNGLNGATTDEDTLYYASTILKNRIQLDSNGDSYVILAIEVENTNIDAYKFEELSYEKSVQSTTYTNQYIVPSVLSKSEVTAFYPSVDINGVMTLGESIPAGAKRTFYVKYSYDKTALGANYDSTNNVVASGYNLLATAVVDYRFVPLYTFTYTNSGNSESKTVRFSMVDQIKANFVYSATPSSNIVTEYVTENNQKQLNLTIETNKLPPHISNTGCVLKSTGYSTNYTYKNLSSISGDVNVSYVSFRGSGTSGSPYLIQSVEDLVELSNLVNGGNTYSGKYFRLSGNLDFSSNSSYRHITTNMYGDVNRDNATESTLKAELTNSNAKGFMAIGTDGHDFAGIFDGNNKTISNLFINETENLSVGLFGSINNATIKNLSVTGSVTAAYHAGGIVGKSYGTSTITNVNNGVAVASSGSTRYKGGIVGYADGGNLTISNSVNTANINDGSGVGGIVGASTGNAVINNCSNSGTITNTKNYYAGGIISYFGGNLDITDSTNTGNVISNRSTPAAIYIGGLIGRSNGNLTINNSSNSGDVYNSVTSYNDGYNLSVGGLVGWHSSTNGQTNIIHNSSNSGTISGGNQIGGIVGYKVYASTLIFNDVHNEGTVTTAIKTGSHVTAPGGIIGYIGGDDAGNIVYIINSYNSAPITADIPGSTASGTHAGGLVGRNNTTVSIINSYNTGTVTSNNYSIGGLVAWSADKTTVTIDNSYNMGELSGTVSRKAGIIYMYDSANETINNVYYLNSVQSTNVVAARSNMTGITNFNSIVNSLNSRVNTVCSVDDTYNLRRWKTGTSNAIFDDSYCSK